MPPFLAHKPVGVVHVVVNEGLQLFRGEYASLPLDVCVEGFDKCGDTRKLLDGPTVFHLHQIGYITLSAPSLTKDLADK